MATTIYTLTCLTPVHVGTGVQYSKFDGVYQDRHWHVTDLDKVLKVSGIDPKPFKPLYPPLTAMAKRRNRIVHEADLSRRTDTASEPWGIADDWQLIMWLMAVVAFYYQLRMSVDSASAVERAMYKRHRKAMLRHVDFGNKLLAFPKVPPELRREALQNAAVTLEGIVATLRLDVSDFEPDLR